MDICGLCPVLALGAGHVQCRVARAMRLAAGHEPRLLGPPDMPIIEALPPGTCPFFEPGRGHLWIVPSPGPGRGTCPVRGGPRHALAPDMSRGCPDHRTCPLLKPSLRGHAHFSSRAVDICGLCPVLAPGAGHVQRRVSASCRWPPDMPIPGPRHRAAVARASCLSGQALGRAMECRLRDGSQALTTEGMSNGGREPGTGPGCHAFSAAGSSL